jgi:phage baseplate assembly protein W
MAELSRQAAEAAAYGVGLLLDDGDVVIDGGQPAIVSGLANLAQALQLRVLTPRGTDPLNGNYGLDLSDALTVGLSRDAMKALVRLNLVRTVAADPRVSEVRSVLFDDDPDYVAAHPDAAPLSGDRARRRSLVEITFDPVPLPSGAAASTSVAALTGGSAISLLTDLSW